MDKNEYRAKLDEINDLVDRQDYRGALKIVDTIDWRRVRSARTLCMVGEIYEANKRYEDSRKLLLMAHHRAPIGRTVLYRLVELSVKMRNFDEAADYYKQFVEISPNDNSRYILKYKLARGKRAPLEEQISILQEYKSREYTERWAYELARLYAKAGNKEACIEECDDLILWFSEGKYVTKAMELKMKYTPLTPIQQDKYDHRFQKGYSPAAAAKAVAAASQAAEKVVSAATPLTESSDGEIEELIKNVMAGESAGAAGQDSGMGSQSQVSDTRELKDKAAQEIMDVLPAKGEETSETAATREPSEKKEYIVKDLEPEIFGSSSEFKPFHVEGAMKTAVKVQAPKSQPIKEEDINPEDFKTDLKEKELDLEALLAETANELAQAVAEETEKTESAEAGEEVEASEAEAEEEAVSEETVEEFEEPEESVEEDGEKETAPEEILQTDEEQEMPAPAAAKAAMVADAIASALMEKAEEFEKDAQKEQDAKQALGDTREIVTEEIIDTEFGVPVVEAVEEAAFEEEMSAESEMEETADTELEEVSEPEAEETVDTEAEEVSQSEAEETIAMEAEEETVAPEETETEPGEAWEEVPQDTKVIPSEEVKEALGEIDLSAALEQELEETVLPEKEQAREEALEETPQPVRTVEPAAFSTAVEGLMRHHLTEEEHRRLFTYFAPVPGMSQQINEALDIAQESACAKTSQAGNIIVTGREGSGKTKLSEGLIKALCKERQMQGAKVAYLEADELNKKDPAAVVDKLSGGFLVVEHAGALEEAVVENMSKAMEFKTNRLTVILEDLKPGIRELEETVKEMFLKGEISFNDQIYITNIRQKNALSEVLESMKKVIQSIDDGMPEDFYSIDLMDAYESLGSITGESVGEDLINEIFSKFCMGK